MAIRNDEKIKILSEDGADLIYALTVPAVFADANTNNGSIEQTFEGLTGQFTVPAGVTKIRFQFDIRSFATPNQTPLVVLDKFAFRKVLD